MFAYLRVCMCACRGGFRPKNLDTRFPPSFLHIYSKYFLAKIFEYKILKNAWNIKFSFYKFSNILSFEVEGQSHFQKPLEASGEAASNIYVTRGWRKNGRKLRKILISKSSFLFILEQNLQNHINKDWKNENSSFYIKLSKMYHNRYI